MASGLARMKSNGAMNSRENHKGISSGAKALVALLEFMSDLKVRPPTAPETLIARRMASLSWENGAGEF